MRYGQLRISADADGAKTDQELQNASSPANAPPSGMLHPRRNLGPGKSGDCPQRDYRAVRGVLYRCHPATADQKLARNDVIRSLVPLRVARSTRAELQQC